MLARLYINAILQDKDLADFVWEAWDRGRLMMTWLRSSGGVYLSKALLPTRIMTSFTRHAPITGASELNR